jgi:hypothetical protein
LSVILDSSNVTPPYKKRIKSVPIWLKYVEVNRKSQSESKIFGHLWRFYAKRLTNNAQTLKIDRCLLTIERYDTRQKDRLVL